MEITILPARDADAEALAALRVTAMRESLEAVGRFEPNRARERFLNSFDPKTTFRILSGSKLVGFYALQERETYFWLDHFYVDQALQGIGIGSHVLGNIKDLARKHGKSIRLGALKQSKANDFYRKHGFVEKEQKEWDIYYEWSGPYS